MPPYKSSGRPTNPQAPSPLLASILTPEHLNSLFGYIFCYKGVQLCHGVYVVVHVQQCAGLEREYSSVEDPSVLARIYMYIPDCNACLHPVPSAEKLREYSSVEDPSVLARIYICTYLTAMHACIPFHLQKN